MKKKILVVDDDLAIRDFLMRFLERRDYEVFSAENGVVGLETYLKEKPDLIISDVQMPQMNGPEFWKSLRERGYEGRIIVVSGNGSSIDYKSLGADSYISKPFRLTTIEEKVDESFKLG